MKTQVLNAADAGDGDIVAQILRQRIAANPDNLTARLALAAHYKERGLPELTLEHYRVAVERFPDSSEVHVLLAKTLRAMDADADAAALLVKFSKRSSSATPELLSLLGIIQDDLGKLIEAEASYRAAVQMAPQLDYLRNNLGYNLLLQGKGVEAATQFQTALEINPRSAIARNNLGVASSAKPAEAVLHWQSIGSPASAHNNMAAVLIEQGHYPEARKELEVALHFEKDHAAALGNLRLVAELDGHPAVVPPQSSVTLFRRVALSIGRALTGAKRQEPDGRAVKAAAN